jgi:hypothetical protein
MKNYRVWMGVGAAALVSLQAPSALKADPHSLTAVVAATGGEGDEGGGVNKDTGLSRNLRFYRNIELIRGHMHVGNELVEGGHWAEAMPHFLHPAKEVYGDVREDLAAYDVPPFLSALQALVETLKTKDKQAYKTALATVEERLAFADKNLQTKETNWPFFALETTIEVLRKATSEYEEAVEGGTISHPVEYQEARGFVFEAEKRFNTVSEKLRAKDAGAATTIQAALEALKSAFPTVAAPKKPVKTLAEMLAEVSKIELQISKLR